jgi:hypothetical protein
VAVDKRSEQEMKDEIVTKIEVSTQITHIEECTDYIKLYQLNDFQ